jgi:hypothetical protein
LITPDSSERSPCVCSHRSELLLRARTLSQRSTSECFEARDFIDKQPLQLHLGGRCSALLHPACTSTLVHRTNTPVHQHDRTKAQWHTDTLARVYTDTGLPQRPPSTHIQTHTHTHTPAPRAIRRRPGPASPPARPWRGRLPKRFSGASDASATRWRRLARAPLVRFGLRALGTTQGRRAAQAGVSGASGAWATRRAGGRWRRTSRRGRGGAGRPGTSRR